MANTFKFGNGKWYGKKGTIMAYNDENKNIKPLGFSFTRDSIATYVGSDGLIKTAGDGEPRVDYTDNTDGHLLLEPARTNSLVQSNQFDTTWATTNVTVASGQTGVGGSTDAWKLSSTGSNSRLQYNISLSGQRAFSIYAKAGTLNFIRLFSAGGDNPSAYFNLSDGTVSSQDTEVNSAKIQNLGSGWYRCEIVFNETISSVRIYPAQADSDISQTSGHVFIQHAQLEAGSYATSLINTDGETKTRTAETCEGAGNSTVINKTQGVLFAEIAALADDLTFRQITLNDGSLNTILIGYRTNSNRIYSQLVSDNVSQAFIGYDVADITEFHKVAVVYENNRVDLWIDGVKRATDTSATMPLNLTNIDLESTSSSAQFYAKTKQIKLYDTALTDSELKTLTT